MRCLYLVSGALTGSLLTVTTADIVYLWWIGRWYEIQPILDLELISLVLLFAFGLSFCIWSLRLLKRR
jgi:hypothetical protein